MNRHFLNLVRVVLFILALMVVGSGDRPLAAQAVGGTFVNSGQALGGETGNGVALGDLDGDGDTDAFVANDFSGGEANQVWFNGGDGFFTSGPTLGVTNGNGVALGDLDDDGDLDAVTAGPNPNQLAAGQRNVGLAGGQVLQEGGGATRVWLNQGGVQGGTEGEFAAGDSFGLFTSYGVDIGDVDNDNDRDVIVVGNSNQVWLNNGSATFVAGPALPFLFSRSVVLADLDGDTWLDAAIADAQFGSNNRVYWNDGNWIPGPGSFTPGDLLPTTNLMQGVAVGNLDEDNQPDIFLAGSGPDQIYWNEGARIFSTAGPLGVNDNSWAIALADVDGDALLDAVIGNISADPNRLWHNEGGRVFVVTQEFGDEIGQYWSRGLGLADLNGDSSADLFEVTTADDRVWFNQSPPPIVPNEEGWQIQTVDERGDTGAYASLALDASGYPHIAYVSSRAVDYDADLKLYFYEFNLQYARWDGVRWQRERVVTSPQGFDNMDDLSLALDGNGYPHIVYAPGGLTRPRYARWDGTAWQDSEITELEAGIGQQVSLTLDSNGNPHVTYAEDDLKYAYWDGAAWQVETIDDSGIVFSSSIVLDANDDPHVSYALCLAEPCSHAHARYARKEGGSWQSEVVGGSIPIFLGISTFSPLALDDGGNPHIGFIDEVGFSLELKHAYWDGNDWQFQTVDTGPFGSFQKLSLDLDSAGAPHFFHVFLDDDTGTYFNYARWGGASWQIETLDYSSNTDWQKVPAVSIALDEADIVHAGYNDPTYGDLHYLT
ncbi:MAG: VCBS repeat-containing protein, partial [Chloroflexi bacterium]|nr:VCBS repeat-containing protein [Chloroflexota bacterium]